MKKVITYGTFDLIHYGHIRLLERAKKLGDYLIVGVTSDDFDKARGKINVQQSITQRVEALLATGIPDKIILEEYEGQKIDDIKRYGVDIFTVGSDWKGTFDYLNEYCEVVYLDRTEGISSSEIRTEKQKVRLGIIGDDFHLIKKYSRECKYVNGLELAGLCTSRKKLACERIPDLDFITDDYNELLEKCDAVYIVSHPAEHYEYIKKALLEKKHVICETPVSLSGKQTSELFEIAEKNNCVLMEGIKTAYALAFERMNLLIKSGVIGDIVSVDATCTSLKAPRLYNEDGILQWGSLASWGAYAMLPIFDFLGTDIVETKIQTKLLEKDYDLFTKISFVFPHSVASIKVGNGVKSEGELIISGTKGYIYVPAPWWKTDYFEVRYENLQENKRYFYQLEGEGIRNMLVSFLKTINGDKFTNISKEFSITVSNIIEQFEEQKDIIIL